MDAVDDVGGGKRVQEDKTIESLCKEFETIQSEAAEEHEEEIVQASPIQLQGHFSQSLSKVLPDNDKFPFLKTPPPPEIFGSCLSHSTQLCVLKTKLSGKSLIYVNSLPPHKAWEYCDALFLEYIDERRSAFRDKLNYDSPLITTLREELKNLNRPQQAMDHSIGDILKTILNKVNNLESQQVSMGVVRPEIAVVAPPFVPLQELNKDKQLLSAPTQQKVRTSAEDRFAKLLKLEQNRKK